MTPNAEQRRASRRDFLALSGKAAVVFAGITVLPARVLGGDGAVAPSNRISMGFIGIGTQGGGHLFGGAWTYVTGGYLGRDEVQVLGVCDVWRNKRESAKTRVNQHYAQKAGAAQYKSCEAYADFRELLARGDIDAVLIASPAHWHAMMSVMAAKAGKDVYCEKPSALNIREGRAMVEAVTRYGRVYQAGTQQRSCYGGKFRKACEYVRSGRIGALKEVYAMLGGGGFNPCPSQGKPVPVPPDLDWDLFLGPAPLIPYCGRTSPHLFGWGSDNWGQHHYDIVQWGIGADDTGPVEIGWNDKKLAYRYANGVVLYGAPYPGEKIGGQGGAIFVGTEGRIAVDRDALVSYPGGILEKPLTPGDVHLYKPVDHASNFLDCVRTRKRPICDAETAHRAISVLLLGGIAEQLKRTLKWNPQREHFIDDPEADRMLGVAQREPWRI